MRASANFNSVRDKLEKVAWITLFWIFISVLQFLLTVAAAVQFGLDLSGVDPIEIMTGSIITGMAAGIFGGSTMVIFWEKWLRSMSYGWSLVFIFCTYSVIYAMVATIGGLFYHSLQLDLPLWHEQVLGTFAEHVFNFSQIASFVFWLFVVLATLIALQVNDKYGPGIFVSFLLGKYFKPKREQRIFMFLDLRSSTHIAEKLGERRYFDFLKELFRDITPGILKAGGEVYQYVGDEMVVSWKIGKDPVSAHCITCYFNIAQILTDRSSYYQEVYDGIIPVFKAGMHAGYAMVGEIGVVKREIAYSGDVLNTTSRIQEKCNELGVDLLLSSYLLDKIKLLPAAYRTRALGAMELRGKQGAVNLYTIQSG